MNFSCALNLEEKEVVLASVKEIVKSVIYAAV